MFKVTAAAGLYVLVQTLSVIAEPHVWMRSSLKAMNTLGQIKKNISHYFYSTFPKNRND